MLKDYNLDDVFGDMTRDAQGLAHMTLKGKQQQIEVVFGPTYKSLVMLSANPGNTGRGSRTSVAGGGPPLAGGGRGGGGGRGAAAGGVPQPPPAPTHCFEPMVGITDGINLAQKGLYKDVQYVAPDQIWEGQFWVRPSGF